MGRLNIVTQKSTMRQLEIYLEELGGGLFIHRQRSLLCSFFLSQVHLQRLNKRDACFPSLPCSQGQPRDPVLTNGMQRDVSWEDVYSFIERLISFLLLLSSSPSSSTSPTSSFFPPSLSLSPDLCMELYKDFLLEPQQPPYNHGGKAKRMAESPSQSPDIMELLNHPQKHQPLGFLWIFPITCQEVGSWLLAGECALTALWPGLQHPFSLRKVLAFCLGTWKYQDNSCSRLKSTPQK